MRGLTGRFYQAERLFETEGRRTGFASGGPLRYTAGPGFIGRIRGFHIETAKARSIMATIEEGLLDALRALDTPTVCNALEVVAPKRRGYGYTVDPLVCTRPELGSMCKPRTKIIRNSTLRT